MLMTLLAGNFIVGVIAAVGAIIIYLLYVAAEHLFRRKKKGNTMATIIDDIRNEIEGVLERHRGEVEQVLHDGEQIAANPAAQMIAELEHVPPALLSIFGLFMQKIDDEFAKLVPPAPAPPGLPPLPGASG